MCHVQSKHSGNQLAMYSLDALFPGLLDIYMPTTQGLLRNLEYHFIWIYKYKEAWVSNFRQHHVYFYFVFSMHILLHFSTFVVGQYPTVVLTKTWLNTSFFIPPFKTFLFSCKNWTKLNMFLLCILSEQIDSHRQWVLEAKELVWYDISEPIFGMYHLLS